MGTNYSKHLSLFQTKQNNIFIVSYKVMNKYLEPTDADAFLDFPKKSLEKILESSPWMKDHSVECPQCKGHGGWNLRINAYPLHHHENTAENRHEFSHFRASCSHCHGWGYVKPEDANHVHEWVWVKNTGNCLNLHECKTCGKQWEIDSSG